VTVAVLCGVLVLVSVTMIALGLPEQTLLQIRLLQLYSVPLSGALALGVVHLNMKLPTVTAATRVVLGIAAFGTALGLLLMLVGLIGSWDALLPLGQVLTWLTLGFALVWLAAHVPRSADSRTFELQPVDEEADE
jgi:hypothetical protein